VEHATWDSGDIGDSPELNQGAAIRVLIVDDHPMAREWTCNSLANARGVEVIGVAENGTQALRLINDVLPDVVLLDIHLPDISGIEVARRVRAALPKVALVVLTGYDDPTYAQALLQIGVRGFLSKAASAEEIETAVFQAAAGQTTVRSDAARVAVGHVQTKLNPRERQVLSLLVAGRNNLEIADSLGLSVLVVEHHVSQLLRALNARSRAEAIHNAAEAGLVVPSTTFLRGAPAVPALKIYHGFQDHARGTCVVHVQEGQHMRQLLHQCGARNVRGCHSPNGWDSGIGGYGGLELARWIMADCLGEQYAQRVDLLPLFKTKFLTGIDPMEWAITESNIRKWATDQGLDTTAAASEAAA
jgi:DNA-binding NarL/FixJ family response regulator